MPFEPTWARYIAYKRPRISDGAYDNLERYGRNHILPFFGDRQLQAVDGTAVEKWMQQVADDVEDEKIAPKTVNLQQMLDPELDHAVSRLTSETPGTRDTLLAEQRATRSGATPPPTKT